MERTNKRTTSTGQRCLNETGFLSFNFCDKTKNIMARFLNWLSDWRATNKKKGVRKDISKDWGKGGWGWGQRTGGRLIWAREGRAELGGSWMGRERREQTWVTTPGKGAPLHHSSKFWAGAWSAAPKFSSGKKSGAALLYLLIHSTPDSGSFSGGKGKFHPKIKLFLIVQ